MIGIDIAVIALYLVGMIFIALYTRNKAKTVKDYLLAGSKGLNGWMSAFAYGTTYFSAVIFIGYAGKFGYGFGLAAVWIGIGNAIVGALLAWMVLAKRTKNMTVRLDAKTMPDFFFKRYGDEKLKLVSAVVIFIFLIPYAASVYNGLGNLFSIVFNIPSWVVMLVLAAVTALYLFLGGYIATSLTDFIQGIIMFVGVIIMLFFFLASPQVNWGEGLAKLSEEGMGLFMGKASTATNFLYGNEMTLVFLVLLTSFGVWALPQTIHKYYTVRDKHAIKQGTIVSSIFALVIGFGAYFIGGLATLFPKEYAAGTTDNVIPHMIKDVLPFGLLGLIAVLVLAASMSTLASVSLASSSVVTIDIYKTVKKDASDKQVTLLMRILSLAFVVIATLIAFLNSKYNVAAIAYMMGLSWGTLAGCFIGPYVLGVVWKKTTRAAAWTSVIGSLVLTVVLIIVIGYDKAGWGAATFGTALKEGVGASPMIGVICMVYSMLSTFVVSLFTKQLPEEKIKEAFEKEIPNEIV
ncbi:MAG: sodium:solute symporter [Clostridia bacterium]|nr:sodium:solute symporter [Clostridia bacterium]